MSITCGHCKHQHDTVAQVKACALGFTFQPTVPAAAAVPVIPAATAEPFASQKQRDFIAKLAAERGVTVDASKLSMRQASAKITELLGMPKATQVVEKVTMPKVHGGRYAVVIDGVTKFFKVDTPETGTWAGRTFLKIQASDAEYPVKNVTAKKQVLELIAEDPKAAMLRYGVELGHCGHCGRTLTNEESRAAGIGPICAGKMGW